MRITWKLLTQQCCAPVHDPGCFTQSLVWFVCGWGPLSMNTSMVGGSCQFVQALLAWIVSLHASLACWWVYASIYASLASWLALVSLCWWGGTGRCCADTTSLCAATNTHHYVKRKSCIRERVEEITSHSLTVLLTHNTPSCIPRCRYICFLSEVTLNESNWTEDPGVGKLISQQREQHQQLSLWLWNTLSVVVPL